MGKQFNEKGICQIAELSHGSLAACHQPCDRFCKIENIVALSKVTIAIRQSFWLHSRLNDQASAPMLKKKKKK